MQAMTSIRAQNWEDAEKPQERVDRVFLEHDYMKLGKEAGKAAGARHSQAAKPGWAGQMYSDAVVNHQRLCTSIGQGWGSDIMVQDGLSLLPLPGKLLE